MLFQSTKSLCLRFWGKICLSKISIEHKANTLFSGSGWFMVSPEEQTACQSVTVTANWCNLPPSADFQTAAKINYMNKVRQIMLLLVLLPSSIQGLYWAPFFLARTSCGRLDRKRCCILVHPGQAWNTPPGTFLGITMTICANSSLINLFYKLGMLFSSRFRIVSRCATQVTKTTLICLPTSFSSLNNPSVASQGTWLHN